MLTVGDTFPSFAVKAVKGGPEGLNLETAFTDVTSESDPGKWKVVFFWPKDFTFVCPTEIVAFGKLARDFADRDAVVYGVSIDSEFVHLNWRLNHADLKTLPIAMLADIKRELSTALGILMLVVLVPINLMVRQRPQDMGLMPDGDERTDSTATQAKRPTVVIVDPAWAATDWTLTRALRTAPFWWLSLGFFCGLYSWYAVQVHQTKYLVEVGFSSTVAVWALGAVSLLGIPSQIVLGGLSDRIGREWIWTISGLGFVICLAALIGLAYMPSMALVYLMIIAQGLIGYGSTAVMAAVVVEIFEGKHYGSIFGTIMLAGLAGGAAGPWVTGLLHDRYGDYTAAFLLAIAFSLLGCAAIWFAAPRKVRVVAGRAHLFDQRVKPATSEAT